jgi:hypothetical protein
MHRKVDPAIEQRRLELLAEQALAAELGERPVDHPIAGRADDHDLQGARLGEPRVPIRSTVMVLVRRGGRAYLLPS